MSVVELTSAIARTERRRRRETQEWRRALPIAMLTLLMLALIVVFAPRRSLDGGERLAARAGVAEPHAQTEAAGLAAAPQSPPLTSEAHLSASAETAHTQDAEPQLEASAAPTEDEQTVTGALADDRPTLAYLATATVERDTLAADAPVAAAPATTPVDDVAADNTAKPATTTPSVEFIEASTETPTPSEWVSSRTLVGRDAAGRTARLTFHKLAGDGAWRFGSSTVLDLGDRNSASVGVVLNEEIDLGGLCGASAYAAFGTASYEGAAPLNHALAAARANNLSRTLADACDAESHVSAINLGEYVSGKDMCNDAEPCREQSAAQRRALLVSISRAEEGFALKGALGGAIARLERSDPRFFEGAPLTGYDLYASSLDDADG